MLTYADVAAVVFTACRRGDVRTIRRLADSGEDIECAGKLRRVGVDTRPMAGSLRSLSGSLLIERTNPACILTSTMYLQPRKKPARWSSSRPTSHYEPTVRKGAFVGGDSDAQPGEIEIIGPKRFWHRSLSGRLDPRT